MFDWLLFVQCAMRNFAGSCMHAPGDHSLDQVQTFLRNLSQSEYYKGKTCLFMLQPPESKAAT